MPVIDLGSVVGPQGAQGNTGPQGEQGVAGPSLISTTTQTTLNGVLAGDGSVVGVRGVDFTPTNLSSNLIASGGVADALSNAVSNVVENEIIKVPLGSKTGNNASVTWSKSDARITANHEVIAYEYSAPKAVASTMTWTTGAGAVSVTGKLIGTTTLTVYLGIVGTSVS